MTIEELNAEKRKMNQWVGSILKAKRDARDVYDALDRFEAEKEELFQPVLGNFHDSRPKPTTMRPSAPM